MKYGENFLRKLMISRNFSNETNKMKFDCMNFRSNLISFEMKYRDNFLKVWKELFIFLNSNINTSFIFKKSKSQKLHFKITRHQNFISSAPLTKWGSFPGLVYGVGWFPYYCSDMSSPLASSRESVTSSSLVYHYGAVTSQGCWPAIGWIDH